MTDNRPVLIEYQTGSRKGESYIMASVAAARRVHPGAVITRYPKHGSYRGAPFEGEQNPEALPAVEPDNQTLADLKVPELRGLAADLGIDVPSKARKAEIVALIEGTALSDTTADAPVDPADSADNAESDS